MYIYDSHTVCLFVWEVPLRGVGEFVSNSLMRNACCQFRKLTSRRSQIDGAPENAKCNA